MEGVSSEINTPKLFRLCFLMKVNLCPAEPRFIFVENTVGPDQLASEEAI